MNDLHGTGGTSLATPGGQEQLLDSPVRGSRFKLESRSPVFLVAMALLTAFMLLWVILTLWVDAIRFVLFTPEAYTAVDAASLSSRFFGALVLLLFPSDRLGPRLRWIAAGFITIGAGGVVFGVIWHHVFDELTPDHSMYAAIVVWSVAGAMFVGALYPLSLGRRALLLLIGSFVAVVTVASLMMVVLNALPNLVSTTDLELAAVNADAPLPGLTEWHWVLSSVPLLFALLAAAFAVHYYVRAELGAWLAFAMLLLAGSQLHNLFWPSGYSPVLTTSDLLRFLFAVVVIAGGVIELRRIALERQRLLATEQAYSARLTELSELKNTFTAIVAHELHSPLIAVRSLATTLAYPELPQEQRAQTIAAIEQQIGLLSTLVRDVQDISSIDRSSFDIDLRPVSLAAIFANIAAFSQIRAESHAVSVHAPADVTVLADRERIEQVLRNLIDNAVKYSSSGSSIEVRAAVHNGQVRIEVEDEGFGITEDDQERIFECYGRGADALSVSVGGSGLGLYLSRHIVEAHGGALQLKSQPGEGSTFSFELEVIT